jgi:hypothetical protein
VTLPKRFLSKSKLSTYLRTQCDRNLYLSLFHNNPADLTNANIPVPLKTRPSVQLVTKSGREFEIEQFDNLVRAIPSNVLFKSNYAPFDLKEALRRAIIPSFVLQPEIEVEDFRNFSLDNLNLTAEEQLCIPQMSGLRPDVLFLHKPTTIDYEILPDGNRKKIEVNDKRTAISVIDLKNVTEANASYAAEVCLYSYFLANWLASIGKEFQEKYFISDKSYLWKHVEMPRFQRSLSLQNETSALKRISALKEDLQEGLVNYLVFIPSVRKFFKEDIPRVVKKGDSFGWNTVDYHISPKCGSCDWLGNKAWLWGTDKEIYNQHPEHYCLSAAQTSEHLSQISGLSKGATFVLTTNGHKTVSDLIDISSSHPILKKHALLKKNKSQIGERAKAIQTGNLTLDNDVKIPGLAGGLNAEYDIVVNFDAGAGLLTGISIRGILFPPYGQTFSLEDGTTSNFMSLKEEAFVVGKDTTHAEWVALLGFISKLSLHVANSQILFTQNGWGSVSTQICFWEPRQYQELCNAFSRHLLNILQLKEKNSLGLAWIFPAEELMERDEQTAPGIVFIRDIIDSVTRLPLRFTHTLIGVSNIYHLTNMPPRTLDTYYTEPLGNGIPRERIFEIWKCTTGVVQMYGQPASLNDAVTKYGNVLKSHAWALASVTARLRSDFRQSLVGKAPAMNLSIPNGASKVAYDSKLWIQWHKVEAATSETEGKMGFVTKPERLEASYKAIMLGNLVTDFGSHRYEFEVSDESTEAKLEEGKGYYVLGFVNKPGFPLATPRSLNVSINSPEIDFPQVNSPLHKIINVFIEKFDRVNRKIIIRIEASYSRMEAVFNELFNLDLVPINDEPIYLIDGVPYNDSKATLEILKVVGAPACAIASPEAILAMGSTKSKSAVGNDPITPIANVLWNAELLSSKQIRDEAQSQKIADFAKKMNPKGLNDSQVSAITACAKNQLSIIWGPPGTGKTDTLASLIVGLTFEAQVTIQNKNILITGPNYRAVEELSDRLLNYLNLCPSLVADFYIVYSNSREPKEIAATNSNLDANSITFQDERSVSLKKSLQDSTRVTIVATTAHVVGKISELLYGKNSIPVQEVFDFVIIDESSQVPVTLALRPLALLKEFGQIVIAGDHLQMPPISSLEPPRNAEYLVGSIQSYLIKRFKIEQQQLLTNYRSNQDLVDFAKTIGYSNLLFAYNKSQSLQVIADLKEVISTIPDYLPKTEAYYEILQPQRKVTAFIHDDISSSQANEFEAKLVAGLAYCLKKGMAKQLTSNISETKLEKYTDAEFFQIGLGVVTPHKAQKALVIKELRNLFTDVDPKLIFESVDTVERFQGGERQTIIVSYGVGDLDIIEGEEAFLLQMERTNVAVSRAKAKSILIMPKSLAYFLPTEEKTIQTSIALKSYIEEFCNNKQIVNVKIGETERNGEVRWH